MDVVVTQDLQAKQLLHMGIAHSRACQVTHLLQHIVIQLDVVMQQEEIDS